MTAPPVIASAAGVSAAGVDIVPAVTDSLVQHGTALVFHPADKFPAFAVRVERGMLVVDRDNSLVGVFGSVKAAVRCGTRVSR